MVADGEAKLVLPKISADAVLLAEAFNRHSKLVAQYWVLAATINVFALAGSTTNTTEFKVAGIELPTVLLWQTVVVIGAVLNFAYCVSHLQTYRTANTFRAYLDAACPAENRDTYLSSWNMSYQLLESALNRVYPIAGVWAANDGKWQKKFVRFCIKPPIDLAVILAPIFGPIWAFVVHMPKDFLSVSLVAPVLLVSVIATMSLLKAALWDDFKFNPWDSDLHRRS